MNDEASDMNAEKKGGGVRSQDRKYAIAENGHNIFKSLKHSSMNNSHDNDGNSNEGSIVDGNHNNQGSIV